MKRGEIRWYTFRLPDKRRPVLVLTRSEVIGQLNEFIVVRATRTIRGLTTEVILTSDDGMPRTCALNFDHVPGASTLDVEVTNVSTHGFWLFLGTEELFVLFSAFPWFKNAPIAKLTNVERPQPHHLYWPDLDVDLAVDSIRHPEKFPMVARSST